MFVTHCPASIGKPNRAGGCGEQQQQQQLVAAVGDSIRWQQLAAAAVVSSSGLQQLPAAGVSSNGQHQLSAASSSSPQQPATATVAAVGCVYVLTMDGRIVALVCKILLRVVEGLHQVSDSYRGFAYVDRDRTLLSILYTTCSLDPQLLGRLRS